MEKKKGIICIETEWEFTDGRKMSLYSKHLLEFISKSCHVPYIYRRVATARELGYYLRQFSAAHLMRDYPILYLAFHGNTHCIQLEGEKQLVSLEDLAEIANANRLHGKNSFFGRYVHFGSCRTMLGSDEVARNFMEETGAKVVSGYTTSVDAILSAIHDLALFNQYLESHQVAATFRNMAARFGGVEEELGFKYYY